MFACLLVFLFLLFVCFFSCFIFVFLLHATALELVCKILDLLNPIHEYSSGIHFHLQTSSAQLHSQSLFCDTASSCTTQRRPAEDHCSQCVAINKPENISFLQVTNPLMQLEPLREQLFVEWDVVRNTLLNFSRYVCQVGQFRRSFLEKAFSFENCIHPLHPFLKLFE